MKKGAIYSLQYASSSGGTIRADYGRRFVGMYVFGALRTFKPRHVNVRFRGKSGHRNVSRPLMTCRKRKIG